MWGTREAAERLGVSQSQVRMLCRQGVIPAMRIGRDWLVTDLKYRRRRKPKKGGY